MQSTVVDCHDNEGLVLPITEIGWSDEVCDDPLVHY